MYESDLRILYQLKGELGVYMLTLAEMKNPLTSAMDCSFEMLTDLIDRLERGNKENG